MRQIADRLSVLLAADVADPQAVRDAAAALVAALDDWRDNVVDPVSAAGFDRTTLSNLIALMGSEVARDLVDRLTEDLQGSRAALNAGGPCPDAQILRAQGHVLLGLAGSVGATALNAAAVELTAACRAASDPAAIPAARDAVVAAIDTALAFLTADGPRLPQMLADVT